MQSIKGIDDEGTERWNLPNGNFHREDGPAIMWPDGSNAWCLDDIPYTFDDFCDELKKNYSKTDEDIMLIQMRYDTNQDY